MVLQMHVTRKPKKEQVQNCQ